MLARECRRCLVGAGASPRSIAAPCTDRRGWHLDELATPSFAAVLVYAGVVALDGASALATDRSQMIHRARGTAPIHSASAPTWIDPLHVVVPFSIAVRFSTQLPMLNPTLLWLDPERVARQIAIAAGPSFTAASASQ